ncbi:MAG: TolC family protein [Acidobacteriaceae bacterium]|nr:TolC family protein [Acidobacteriaceae bacterium]
MSLVVKLRAVPRVALGCFCLWFSNPLICPAQAPSTFSLQDALRLTLLHHPQLQIQQEQVNAQRGALKQAAGQFNLQLGADGNQAHTYRPLTAYEEFVYGQYGQIGKSVTTNTSQLAFEASRQLRNGIILSPTISATRTTDNLTNLGGISQGSIQFAVTLPLLRGRGRSVVDAQELSSAKQVEAAVFEVNETITSLLAATANSYWSVVAAQKNLDVLKEAEARSNSLVENTQSLIEADRLPRAEINTAKANQAQRIANRMEGERLVVEARQQLAVDMGLDVSQVNLLPEISTDFPAGMDPETVPSGPQAIEAYTQLALQQRPELKALKKREEASQILAVAAKNGLKPQLDVRVSTGASGLDEGTRFDEFLFAPGHSARGMDLSGGITYRFPPARDAAAGALMQANAAKRQVDLQYMDTARRTAAAVTPALVGVRSEAQQLSRTHESVQFYRNAVDAEREKLRMGAGSVLNTLQMQDRLIQAMQTEVQAELEFAQMLVRMRQATSTIVTVYDQGGSIDPDVFSTLPALPPAQQQTQQKAVPVP